VIGKRLVKELYILGEGLVVAPGGYEGAAVKYSKVLIVFLLVKLKLKLMVLVLVLVLVFG
jgi:hypothetical protein